VAKKMIYKRKFIIYFILTNLVLIQIIFQLCNFVSDEGRWNHFITRKVRTIGLSEADIVLREVLMKEQQARELRDKALEYIRKAICDDGDAYQVKEWMLEAIEHGHDIDWSVISEKVSQDGLAFLKKACRLLQRSIKLKKETAKLKEILLIIRGGK